MNSDIQYMVNGIKYSISADLHTHSMYSHGSGSIEENVLAARMRGLSRIGICDHGPSHIAYGIKKRDIARMRREIDRLNAKYDDIDILLGVEANIGGPSGKLDIKAGELGMFDFIAAGYHYGAWPGNPVTGALRTASNFASDRLGSASKAQIRANTRCVVRALEKNDIKILTHPGDKAPVDLLEVAAACARTDTLVELNTLHMSLGKEELKTMMLADIYFIISSDAHDPDRVGDFESALTLAIEAGIDPARIINLKVGA